MQKPSSSFQRIRALIRKESLQVVRDTSSILVAFFLPVLLLFLYGSGVSLDLKHLKIGLVMEDESEKAMQFAASLTDSIYFDVEIVRDRKEIYPKIESGEVRGFVVIPSYFSEFFLNPNRCAPIQVIADGSEANTANFVQYYVQGAFANFLTQEAINRDVTESSHIETDPRFWYNKTLESRFFLLSGSLAITMTLIGTLLTALVVSREWERGTMESLISTPIARLEIVLGKTVPYFILGLFSMCICVFVSTVIYGLPLRGSYLALFLVSASFLICALGLGLLISLTSKIQIVSSQVAIIIGFLPAYVLSGFLFDISSMPLWIQYLTYMLPFPYFVQSLQTIFLVGDVWSMFLKNIAVLLFMSIVLFWAISHKIAKRLE